MTHSIKATYRQAEALYQLAQQSGYQVATLLHYSGQPQNCPPRRLIMVQNARQCHLLHQPFLADDLRQNQQPKSATLTPADPLFPHKAFRFCVVDQLV